MMNIDEAIRHCEEAAEQNDTQAEKWQKEGGEEWGKTTVCRECASDHRQLAAWLRELKELRGQIEEYKRLLKEAVPIINNMFPEVGSCWGCANHDEANDRCKAGAFEECAEVCKWKHADEAEKLIGGEN